MHPRGSEHMPPFFMHPDSECFYCTAVSLFLPPVWLVDVTFFLTTFLLNALFWTSGVVLEYCMRIAGRHRIRGSHLLFLSPMALLGRGMCSLKSEMNTFVTSLESVIFLFFLTQSSLCSMIPLSSPPSPPSPLCVCVCAKGPFFWLVCLCYCITGVLCCCCCCCIKVALVVYGVLHIGCRWLDLGNDTSVIVTSLSRDIPKGKWTCPSVHWFCDSPFFPFLFFSFNHGKWIC